MAILSLSATLPVLAQEVTVAEAPAAPEEITVSLAFHGPPRCGSESDLASRIAWRTSRVRIVPVGSSERHLDVALETSGGTATATLSLTLPNGRRATRVLKAATCDEAVDAAALVAAVTLDPTASTSATPPPDAGASDAGFAGSGGAAADAAPPVPAPDAGGGRAGDAESRSVHSVSMFVPVELIGGPAPDVLYGVGIGSMWVWERGSVISPAARLTLVYFFGQEFQETGGTAYFDLKQGALDLCPLRLGSEMIAAHFCASLAYGVLKAEGRQTTDPQTKLWPWWVLGGTLLGALRPIELFEVQLFGTVGSPLYRNVVFQFDCAEGVPDCEPNRFHEVPAVTAYGGVALGVFFR